MATAITVPHPDHQVRHIRFKDDFRVHRERGTRGGEEYITTCGRIFTEGDLAGRGSGNVCYLCLGCFPLR